MPALKYVALACIGLACAAALLLFALLRASLPDLDGVIAAPNLSAAVRIERDARGVATIEAANRLDLAYGTGFVHAQDRYFEMDLSRRLAAGELAELFGQVALPQDRRARLFRFRAVAREVIAQATPEQRAVLEAYTRGVNAGLAHLGGRPWEYWVLGAQPSPWLPEDVMLVEYAMWWDLQANGLRRELLRQEINAGLGGPECASGWKCALGFFYPLGTSWDAPAGASAPPPASVPIPDAAVLDVRAQPTAARVSASPTRVTEAGSNNWAVAGSLTANGAALIANDMHLTQRVPTIWYHARLKIGAGASEPALDLTGVTLPGTPLLVAGSNGHIAWGFTNSYGDWIAVEAVPCTSVAENALTTPAGERVPLTTVREEIRVRGAEASVLEVRSDAAGVLLRVDAEKRLCWFGAWLAELPSATNMKMGSLERVSSVADALALAPEVGIPHQNFVVGDRDGHIGWAILGRIPEDTSAARARHGAPWTTAADHPHIFDPEQGRIWTANARVVTDPHQQELIGGHVASFGAQYDLGARAGQIRDDLLALRGALTPADMLRIQLDDRGLFLERWRTLILSVLDADATAATARRAEFRHLVEAWNGQASADAVGYRLVRAYREQTAQSVWEMLLGALSVPSADGAEIPAQFEGPLWRLVSERPLHLLAKEYADWPAFLRAQVDATIAELDHSCGALERCTWGAHNRVQIRHPLSRAIPWLAGLLDMPTVDLPGDHDMPRVQDGAFGASERFAVSPGHEAEGYLVLPGGQSGHPLSPYYRADFHAWAHGQSLPFLPGAAEHTLTLAPN
ncbi:MAG TPA: penicillin acylase family protein [Steroidobacteraceae bacterium]|nr:penicillin acylase family protein [Steroidobacteraceae bacterium]